MNVHANVRPQPRPTATFAIAGVTALAWLVASALTAPDEAALRFGFIPARLSGLDLTFAAVPAFLTPLSSALVHAGPFHLIFNLIIFLWCGAAVERLLGAASLVFVYLVGAYAAALAQWALDPASVAPMVGASGAVSAVIGAYALSFGRPRQLFRSARLNRWVNALWLLAAWVVLQIAVAWLAGMEGYLLATPAHVGGFVAGLLLQRPLLLWRYRRA